MKALKAVADAVGSTWKSVVKDGKRTLSLDKLNQWEEHHAPGERMRRSLGFVLLTMLVVANVIGAGVFVMTGDAAAKYAGPAVSLSYALAGVVAILASRSYARRSSKVRGAGSAVTYAYISLGEFLAVMIGWDLFCEVSIGSAAVAAGWSGNVKALLVQCGIHLPDYVTETPTEVAWIPFFMAGIGTIFGLGLLSHFWKNRSWQGLWKVALAVPALVIAVTGGIEFFTTLPSFNLPAVLVVYFVTAVLLIGVSEAAWATTVFTVLKVLVLIVFVVLGIRHFDPNNLQPFTPFGFGGVLHGASIVFFAFVGFESVTTSAEECKNPQRDIPRAIMWGVGICTVIYMVVSLVLVGCVSYTLLGGSEKNPPMANALKLLGYEWGFAFVAIGSAISLLSVLLVSQYGLSRLARSLSKFGLMPQFFGSLNKRQVPFWSVLIFGQLVATAAALLPVDELAHLCNIGTLAAFIVVCIADGRAMLADNPGATGRQKVKLLLEPTAGVIGCLVLIAFLPPSAWIRFVLWMIPGAALWVFWGRKRSRLTTEAK